MCWFIDNLARWCESPWYVSFSCEKTPMAFLYAVQYFLSIIGLENKCLPAQEIGIILPYQLDVVYGNEGIT